MRDSDSRALVEAENWTRERHEGTESRKTERGYTFGAHAEGELLNQTLLAPLTAHMGTPASRPRNKDLWDVVRHLTPQQRAFTALSALGHYLATANDDDDPLQANDDDEPLQCGLKIGRVIYAEVEMLKHLKGTRGKKRHRLRKRQRRLWKFKEPNWPDPECVEAGQWVLDVVCEGLPDYFVLPLDLAGVPRITKEGERLATALVEELILNRPIFVPIKGEIKDWTRWRCGGYWDDGSKISASFVRGPRPEVKRAFGKIFRQGTIPHVEGVNTLQRVPFVINDEVLPVVKHFARKIGKVDRFRFARDIRIAETLSGKTWCVPLNCDFRGRIYGVSDFNFQREDHVRALFRFAKGAPIGDEGLRQLKIHTANTYGGPERIDKKPFHERIKWVEDHRKQIERVAQNPFARANNWWKEADAPFQFVAACKELAAAWKAGPKFETTLPICIDASCSGIQHLAMMMRDEDAGFRVNLIPSDKPEDIYQDITVAAEARLKRAAEVQARWWLKRGINRKLIKRPAMTYGYSVSRTGMAKQLDKVEPAGNTFYFAEYCEEACKEILPGPTRARDFIKDLAKEAYNQGKHLEFTMPSGFPWINAYYKSNVVRVELASRNERARVNVGDGFTSEIRKGKSKDAGTPNFVHAWDAAHLIFVALALAAADITHVVTVHDCVGFLAPQVQKGREIILDQLAELYTEHDPLAELRDAVGSTRPPLDKGSLDPNAVRQSLYAFA